MSINGRNNERAKTAGTSAMLLGAGAYMMSNRQRLTLEGSSKVSSALMGSVSDFSKHAFADINSSVISKVYKDNFGSSSPLRNVPTTSNLRINIGDGDNILSLLNTSEQLQGASHSYARKMTTSNRVNLIRSSLVSEFSPEDSIKGGKLADFVDRAWKNWDTKAVMGFDSLTQRPIYDFNYSNKFLGEHFDKNTQQVVLDVINQIKDDHAINSNEVVERLTNRIRSDRKFTKINADTLVSRMQRQVMNIDDISNKLGRASSALDRSASINEVLDAITNNQLSLNGTSIFKHGDNGKVDAIEALRNLVARNSDYGSINFGGGLRINANGRIYSSKSLSTIGEAVKGVYKDSIFGKILKANDLMKQNTPDIFHFKKGTYNPILAAFERAEGTSGTSRLRNDYVHIHGKTYKMSERGLTHISELDNYEILSTKNSVVEREARLLQGDTDMRKVSSKIAQKLDLGTTGVRSSWAEKLSIATKYHDPLSGANILKDYISGGIPYLDINDVDSVLLEHKKLTRLNHILKNESKTPTKAAIKKLKESVSLRGPIEERYVGGLLDIAAKDNDEMIEGILNNFNTKGKNGFQNTNLNAMLNRYKSNAQEALMSYGTNAEGRVLYHDSLRREIVKESFLTLGSGADDMFDPHLLHISDDVIETASMSAKDKASLRLLNAHAIFQSKVGLHNIPEGATNISTMYDQVLKAHEFFKTEGNVFDSSSKQLRSMLKDLRSEKYGITSINDHVDQSLKKGYTYGEYMLIQKTQTPLDLIKNLNDVTKRKAAWQQFSGQFTANRNNMRNYSKVTAAMMHLPDRLFQGLERYGLGFSSSSTQSAANYMMNIGLKRILPVAGVLTGLSYLNFEARNLTGTSLGGSLANVRAQTSLAARNPITVGAMNMLRDVVVPLQYILDEPVRTREEEEEFLSSGYEPVRKSRWWSFGSMSEFRGGNISFYQPSYLRRAHSTARDIGIYGSEDEKWAHSWIPTPRHPLAPLTKIFDPYWLEKKHYYDRPYPVSGKMFSEGTPWGAILNPTVGDLLKPSRMMHQDVLQGNVTDVRDIIEMNNEREKLRAQEGNDGYVRFNAMGQYENISPVMDKTVQANMRLGYGKVEFNGTRATGGGPNVPYIQQKAIEHGIIDDNMFKIMTHPILSGLVGDDALSLIERHNQDIKAQANNKGGGGPMGSDAIFKTTPKIGSAVLHKGEALADLRNIQSGHDYVNDTMYSLSQLSGIYGFGIGEIIPREQRYALATADAMTGIGDVFWDDNIGGLGGTPMEIARRFFPHENRGVTKLNYIRNTMPDWMPSKFRYGDPYEQVQKGEMRLPGAGYEDLYNLHSDEHGKYGAFDRMKILADIAPWSSEYKTWRDIASREVRDPRLQKEIREIKRRVIKQSKKHEFFNYRFAGKDTDTTNAIISEVMDKGQFKVVGSEETYQLAGIRMLKQEEGAPGIDSIFQAGMRVKLKVDENTFNRKEKGAIQAAVVVREGMFAETIQKKLIHADIAEMDRNQTSAAAEAALYTGMGQSIGAVTELLAHAQIPYIHDKFMRVNSPLESYIHEQVYGTPYATWSHPFRGFLIPSLRRGWANGMVTQTLAVGSMMLSNYANQAHLGKGVRRATNALTFLTNRGAAAGAITENLLKLNITSMASIDKARVGANIGSAALMIGHTLAHLNNPLEAAYSGSLSGSVIGKQLGGNKGALIGAGVGAISAFALSGQKTPIWKMGEEWIPDETKERWDVEEYFDRLQYVKYHGLYSKAARLAESEEDTNIDLILDNYEEMQETNQAEIDELYSKLEWVQATYSPQSERRSKLEMEINQRINELRSEMTGFIAKAGKYTKAAIAYRRAYESTVYGLKDNASWAQILRATPKEDRDYVLEFAKVTDPEKREEIMEYVNPYERKLLQAAWGMKMEDSESNMSYFQNHTLPGSTWTGFKPSVDLDKVKIKTIANEGMELADFGFYESQLKDPETEMAPDLTDDSLLGKKLGLLAALNGAGLMGVEVSVEPSDVDGWQIMSNIVRTTEYELTEPFNNAFGKIFF